VPRGAARHPRGEVMLGWWSRGRVITQKAKSRYLRREKWSRPGAVGMVGQSTCMPHVVHDVNKACRMLACPEERLDIPRGEVMLGWWCRGLHTSVATGMLPDGHAKTNNMGHFSARSENLLRVSQQGNKSGYEAIKYRTIFITYVLDTSQWEWNCTVVR
jgi:hypothetical protein